MENNIEKFIEYAKSMYPDSKQFEVLMANINEEDLKSKLKSVCSNRYFIKCNNQRLEYELDQFRSTDKDNNGTINNKNLFSIHVTKWGKSFLSDGNLVFTLTDKVRGTKLSPITISVSKNISQKDIVIRSITIRKIEVNK